MLREPVPVSPKSNYCVCGAWMVLIHVIRLADPIREFLQDKPEETTSHPRRSSTRQSLCAWGGHGDTLGGLCWGPCWGQNGAGDTVSTPKEF